VQREHQKRIVEALLIAAPEPVSAAKLAGIVPGLDAEGARALVAELEADWRASDRAFEVWEVAGGFQVRTLPDLAGWVRELHAERPLRLSRAALETLAVVAWRQPVTRAEIEHVRGVDVDAVLRTLVERHLVRPAGHRDVPGRPMLYATTKRFLEVFGLARLEDLPTLREIDELVPPGGFESTPEAAPASGEDTGDDAATEDESPPDEDAEDDPGRDDCDAGRGGLH
jgi:segregation and condensation protein B